MIRRWNLLRLLVTALMTAVAVAPVAASTWSVEKDGSGDFITIQAAVDA